MFLSSDRCFPEELSAHFRRSNVALALADMQGDHPLLFVNDRFSALTGYVGAEVLGKNCRLLQRDADNGEVRERIRAFLRNDAMGNVRTPIVNFRKDGTPFVNLLYMSKLRGRGGDPRYVFASQFDISRSRPDMLADYDEKLARTLGNLTPILSESGIVIDGSLITVANSVATIAQAKFLLASLDDALPLG